MEIDITRFFETVEPSEFSASVAEMGQDAGKITWANAMREASETPLLTTEEQIEMFRDYMRGFGAWEEEDIVAWSHDECNALLVQMISGDIREAGLEGADEDAWQEYEEDDNNCGRLYRGTDGRIYYYVGD